jgi:hypothetical protein
MVSAVLSSFCFASLFSAGGGTKSPALASRDESLVNWSGKDVTITYQCCCCCCFLLGVS